MKSHLYTVDHHRIFTSCLKLKFNKRHPVQDAK